MISVKNVRISKDKATLDQELKKLQSSAKYSVYSFEENDILAEPIVITKEILNKNLLEEGESEKFENDVVEGPVFAIDAKHANGTELSSEERTLLSYSIALDFQLGRL